MYDLIINYKTEHWTKGFEYQEPSFRRKALFKTKDLYIVKGNAFHSCKSKKCCKETKGGYGNKIVKMIIPKGAYYYENTHEYASNKIIYPL